MTQLVEFTMLSRSCAAVSRLVGTLRRSIGLNRAVAAVIRFTTEFAERFRREHKVVSINNLLCSLCGFSASSAVKTASNAFLKRAALAAVILLLGAAAVLAQTSSNGWTFSVKGDGTASLGKPVDEVWEYNPQLWEEWNDGSKEWVWYGGMQFKGYTDHIASTLLLPSSVTTQTVTWDSDSHSYVRNYGATYTVTETGSGLTTAQRTALISVSIPSSISTITVSAFSNCNLSSITIPASVTTIGVSAFENNPGLLSVTVTIPASVTSMGAYAFQNCRKLKSVVLTESLKNIGQSAFQGDSSLVSVTIPASVTSMGTYVFQNCTGLQSANIQNSTIANFQFVNCTSLMFRTCS